MNNNESKFTSNELLEIEKDFWKRNKDRLGTFSQYKSLYETILPKIRHYALSEKLDEWQYEEKLREFEDILDDIAFALNNYLTRSEAKKDSLWGRYSYNDILNRPAGWTAVSPINPDLLDAATARYFKNPLIQSNTLEWYILKGFVYDALARYSDAIESGLALGRTNWGYAITRGNFFKAIFLNAGLGIIKFIIKWILLPAIAALFYFYFKYELVAIWFILAYTVLVVINIILIPKRLIQRRERKKKESEINNKLEKYIAINEITNSSTINPKSLKTHLEELQRDGIYFHPAVYSILGRAIQRDSAVFTLD